MEVLVIIPARGGSQSVPRKNIRPLLGKPLIAWAVEKARDANLVNRVIVSTDDKEIADVAHSYGAEVPFLRPADISQNFSTDIEFLLHALSWLDEHEGYKPDIVVTVRATAPLFTSAHIDMGIETLIQTSEADAVRPISSVSTHPYKMWAISEDGKMLVPFVQNVSGNLKEPYNLPRQDLPKVYRQTGAMDVMWFKTIVELKSTSGKQLGYFFMDAEDSIDIDYPIDFEIAEFLLKKRIENNVD